MDVGAQKEEMLKKLHRKISLKAVYILRLELNKDLWKEYVSNDGNCYCPAKCNFGLLCCHDLNKIGNRCLELDDIPQRWWIEESAKGQTIIEDKIYEEKKPWMSYVATLEEKFRLLEGNYQKSNSLMKVLDDVFEAIDADTDEKHPNISIPLSSHVSYPGRPRSIDRFSSLPKDFLKSGFKRNYVSPSALDEKCKLSFLYTFKLLPVILITTVAIVSKKQTQVEHQEERQEERQEELLTANVLVIPTKRKKCNPVLIKPERRSRLVLPFILPRPPVENVPVVMPLPPTNHDFEVHSSINPEHIIEKFNPRDDGFCGFRAAAHCIHKKQFWYPRIEEKMLGALRFQEEVYKNFFGMDVGRMREAITCGIDRPREKIEKCDQGIVVEEDKELNKQHRNLLKAPFAHWFQSPYHSQILADAYGVPVCVYPTDDPDGALTFLPVDRPHVSYCSRVIHLQHIAGVHWGSLELDKDAVLPIVWNLHFHVTGKTAIGIERNQ
ncbi:hypothetical protein ABG067_007914, partial [Albugo candida]